MFQLFKGKRNEKRSMKLPPGLSKTDQRRVQEVIDRAKKNDGVPRTAQQSIPFDRMFPDGICRVGSFYTKTIQFQDINYQLAQQEDKTAIFEEWCGFLNFFDSSIHFELSFMNMTTDAESFEAGIRIPYQKDEFNSVRDEYSEMLKNQLAQGNNGLTKTKFLTFGIEADSMKQAKPRLEHVQNDLLNNFKQLGVRAEVLNGYQRLKLMHDMFHMGDPEDKFRFDWKWLAESGLSVKDFIAPTAFAFPGSRTFQMGSLFGAMSYLQITASDLSDQLLKDFLDMDSSQIITMHIQSVDQTEAIKTIKHTITELDRSKIEEQKKAVRSGYDMDIIPSDLATYGKDAKSLLKELQSQNERMFMLTMLIMNTGKTQQELDTNVFQASSIAQKHNCNLRRLDFQQENALMSCLPLANCLIDIRRALTTSSTAIFVPFTTQELFQAGKESLYYGLNALSNNLIIIYAQREDMNFVYFTDKDIQMSVYDDRVVNPLVTGKEHLYDLINAVLERFPDETPVDRNWIISPYAPTPTIIEAARSLYENHSVEDITRHEADKVYTDRTIGYILQVIKKSKDEQRKSICFVTGVPGAGKTLVGLDVAIKQTYQGHAEPVEDEGAVYLSGNGPLVAVLTEALAQDNYKKSRENNEPKKLSDSRREVSKSIQMIHRYRDNMLAKIKNPVENGILEIDPEKAVKMENAGFGEVEHVAIFDEAQRSWTHKRLADYLKRGGTYGNKLKVPNFPMSEAAFLIWSLDQREDWATIVCLVGGGQEINTGEAGISEWIAALNQKFPQWDVYISPKLTDAEYAEGKVNELLKDKPNVTYAESLHLAVSLRSYRAEKLSAFVHALLSFDDAAAKLYAEIKDHYPIVLTRDMAKARKWLHEKVRGTERTGVLVTKEAARFKPLAIHILPTGDENAVHWFLEDKTDTRSSNYLEDAATEIQVQGLELDYTCLLWDADMRYEDGKWRFYNFNGNTKWNEVTGDSESKQEKVKYMLNAYRVLLTRARAGMVICVPEGNPNKTQSGFWEDSTRLPEYYDGTYHYLKSIGIEEL